MSILIIAVSPYVHDTAAVAWGLSELKHDVDVYFPADYPAYLSLSLKFDSQGKTKTVIDLGCQQAEGKSYKSVWLRHKLRITEESTLANASDASFAASEADHLIQSILHLLSPSSMWVNPPRSIEKAFLKPLQLATALEIGFLIPKTLMSNNPKHIAEFISMVGDVAVFKTFNAADWKANNKYVQSMSTLIKKDLINDSATICPAIYQEVINKQADIRVIVMGKQLFAIQQDSSKTYYVDSRLARRLDNPVITPVKLPDAIQLQCLQLMERLGLTFGCIDLALDVSGAYWFFEVNPNGQFLFYEEICPSLPLLDTFCEFLACGSPDYLREQRHSRIRFSDFLMADGKQTPLVWQKNHIQVPFRHVYQE